MKKHEIPFMRNQVNYDTDAASREAALQPDKYGESMTVQSQAEDADINVIMKRFGVTGQLPDGLRAPEYGDYSEISDFRSAIEAVRAAQENFMTMPGEVRARFENDPQLFLDFCADERNLDEMRKLGLAVPKAVEAAIPPPPIPEAGGDAVKAPKASPK